MTPEQKKKLKELGFKKYNHPEQGTRQKYYSNAIITIRDADVTPFVLRLNNGTDLDERAKYDLKELERVGIK